MIADRGSGRSLIIFAADIHHRRETSGGTDHFDEHRKRIADQILFVPRAARRQRDRAIEQQAPSLEEPQVC